MADILKRPGAVNGVAYTVVVPRDDLTVLVEGVQVPPEAGLESRISFYAGCCGGKLGVAGQICVLDYELNDVIDALRERRIEIVSIAPMLLHTRDRVSAVRFQGEGDPAELAKGIRRALRWIGKDRDANEEPDPKTSPALK